MFNQVLFYVRLYLATEIINQTEKCGNIVRCGHLRLLFYLDNQTVTEDAYACNPYPELALNNTPITVINHTGSGLT